MPSFGDGKEDQRRIEALTQEITDLLKKSEKRLQRLCAGGPSEDSNIRKNVQRSLTTDLQSLSMDLRKKQSTYLKHLRQQKEVPDGVDLEMNLNGNNFRREDDELDDMAKVHQGLLRPSPEQPQACEAYQLKCRLMQFRDRYRSGMIIVIGNAGSRCVVGRYVSDKDMPAKKKCLFLIGLNEHQMAKLRKSEAFTAEREREIQQVVESVNDLAQIMKDLSVLVIDQGTIVDRIDYNIQNVAASVEEGLKQLKKVLLIFTFSLRSLQVNPPLLTQCSCIIQSQASPFSPLYQKILVKNVVFGYIGITGRENAETRGDGDVCFSSHHHVLHHVSPPNS
ncbi:syntaxin of plants 41 [Actinidia rufa]|uniref:Syntaxin of plants 41 n=1 Tax=Actinidia rufa TaxID=165716 RepID=A0A7J0F8I4_9ERIC|nr:syntaxin of plants 41 [Actinidia rufa]